MEGENSKNPNGKLVVKNYESFLDHILFVLMRTRKISREDAKKIVEQSGAELTIKEGTYDSLSNIIFYFDYLEKLEYEFIPAKCSP